MTRSQAAAKNARTPRAFYLYKCADFLKIVKRSFTLQRVARSKFLPAFGKKNLENFSTVTLFSRQQQADLVSPPHQHRVASLQDLVVGADAPCP